MTSHPSLIKKYQGRANIYRCPGGEEACPETSGSTACNTGYQGIGCATCAEGYAWSHGHTCVACAEGESGPSAGLAVPIILIGGGVYYRLLARPLFTGFESAVSSRFSTGAQTRSNLAKIMVGFVQSIRARYHRWRDMATKNVRHYSNMLKIIVGFLQVLTSLLDSHGDIHWPVDFTGFLEWFSFLKFSLDMPATACLTKDYVFVDRLVFYTSGPLVLLVLMILLSL